MNGGLIIALVSAVLAGLLFLAATNMVAEKLSRIGPAIAMKAASANLVGGRASGAGDLIRHAELVTHKTTHDGSDT